MMICLVLFLGGCSPFMESHLTENNLIEEIAPVIFWSVNKGEEGKLKVSTLVPPLTDEKKRLNTLEVDLLKQGEKGFNLTYYREVKTGQLRMMLINEEVAKDGLLPVITTLLVDTDVSQRLYLVIVKGDFEEYMSKQIEKQENLDYFIYRMLKHYEDDKGEITVINLHQFKNYLYSPFLDPLLPVFKIEEDKFMYEGTAFFNDDKFVANVNGIEDNIVQLLATNNYLDLLPLPEQSVTLGHVQANVDTKLNDLSSISIKVKLNGSIDEYRGDKDIHDYSTIKEINKEAKVYLEKKTKEVLKQFQEWKVDPLHFGTLTLKPFEKKMDHEEWMKHWEDMEIDVEYELEFEPLTNIDTNDGDHLTH
ncbi:Ger(x)C family spore germination C-terminal domain-containing protein [Jeotgalibacillus soli]|nr:Ger(x)C family spore germination C-terminal domain-containing protein [Jeotgalibacillus soli]